MMFIMFPIIFPFYFLIYTDILSLILILSSMYFLHKQKYNWSAVFVIASFFVRQNNIMWLGFHGLYIFFTHYDIKEILQNKEYYMIYLKYYILQVKTYIIGIFIFATFYIINGGFIIADRKHHVVGIYFGNIWFCLFLCFMLFLPMHLYNLPKIIEYIKKNKNIVLLLLGVLLLFLGTYGNFHEYNLGEAYLRNLFLLQMLANPLFTIWMGVVICYAIISLIVTPLNDKRYYLLYPVTFLYLVPSWLIEQRYYTIPFVLFILFKKDENNSILEGCTLLYYAILIIVIMYGIATRSFFL